MTQSRVLEIRRRLNVALQPVILEISDDSHLHVGHAGAQDGRGHFSVRIVSPSFAGAGRLQRHRMVYKALDELMQSDIHALAIEALAPEEVEEV